MRTATDKVRICAANNADLYQAIFRAHALPDNRNAAMWWSEEISPPYYSNLTTLDPEAYDTQWAAVDRLKYTLGRPFSVKDAFRRMNLESQGFQLLLEAAWIWGELGHATRSPTGAMPAGWLHISDDAALEAWEGAWAAGGSPANRRIFPPAILDDPNIGVLGRVAGQGFDAGCIVNLSPGVAGLSNVFSIAEPASGIFETAACAATAFAPGLPLVGYERGEAFKAAIATGFKSVGKLRIWLLD